MVSGLYWLPDWLAAHDLMARNLHGGWQEISPHTHVNLHPSLDELNQVVDPHCCPVRNLTFMYGDKRFQILLNRSKWMTLISYVDKMWITYAVDTWMILEQTQYTLAPVLVVELWSGPYPASAGSQASLPRTASPGRGWAWTRGTAHCLWWRGCAPLPHWG